MRNTIIGLLILICWLFGTASPVYAIKPPDSISIRSVKVVQNTIEKGDMAIVFHYNITYTDYPEIAAEDTIIFRLYNPTGTLVLASAVPYTYFNNGYGNGVGSFYFDASLAPAWKQAYLINIIGSPAFFDPTPTPYTYTLTSADYSSVDDQEDNQLLMASYIISVCKLMERALEDVTLHGSTDVGIVLSDVGESYFRGAVPGIQSIAPSLFFTQFYVPTPEYIDTSTAQAEEYAGRLVGTDIMNGFDALGGQIGLPGVATAGGVAIISVIGLVIFTSRKGWGALPGIMAGGIVLLGASLLLGNAIMVITMVVALIAGILIMYLFFFKRS